MSDRRKQRERYEVLAAEFEAMRRADPSSDTRYSQWEARYRHLADSFGKAIEVHAAALSALRLH